MIASDGESVWLLTCNVFGDTFAIRYVVSGKYFIETEDEIDATRMSTEELKLKLTVAGCDRLYVNRKSPYMRDVFDMSFLNGCEDVFESVV